MALNSDSFAQLPFLVALFFISCLVFIDLTFSYGEKFESDSSQIFSISSIAYFPSPLKQISQGIVPSDVTCTEGKELVLKQSNGFPACVYLSSVEPLIARNWAIHILPDYSSQNNVSEIFMSGKYLTSSEIVIYGNGDDTSGYLAKPVLSGKYPGIVMIHEWWGLNNDIKSMADILASHGYVVLSVDLYGGKVATTSEQARQLITMYDSQQGLQNMQSAISFLNNNYSTEKIGSIGWCFGGAQSLNLAINSNDDVEDNNLVDATVIYYGTLVTDPEKLSSINWPVLGIFAELDKGITIDAVNEFESSLNDLNIQNDIYIYSGVDHAFANPSGDRYAPEESQDAWDKTIIFLDSVLR